MIPSPLLPTSPGCLAYTLLHQAGVAITATRPSNMSLKRPRTTTLAIFIGFFALNLPVATAELRAAARVTRREAELNFDDDGPTSTTGSVRSAALVRASSLQIFRARKTCELPFFEHFKVRRLFQSQTTGGVDSRAPLLNSFVRNLRACPVFASFSLRSSSQPAASHGYAANLSRSMPMLASHVLEWRRGWF